MEKKTTTACDVKLRGPKETNQQSVPPALGATATGVRPRWTIPEIYRSLPLYPCSLNRRPVVAYSYRPSHVVQHDRNTPKEETVRAQSNIRPKIAPRPAQMLNKCVAVSTKSCDRNANTRIQESSSTFTNAQNWVSRSKTLSGISQPEHPTHVQMQQLPQNVFYMSPVPVPNLQAPLGLMTVSGTVPGKQTSTVNVQSNVGDPSVACKDSGDKTTVTYNLAGPFQMPKFSKSDKQLLGEQTNSPRLVFGNQSFPVLSVISTPQKVNNPGSSVTSVNTPHKVNNAIPSTSAINPTQNVYNPLASLAPIDPRQKRYNSVPSAALNPPGKVFYTVDPVALPSVLNATAETKGQSCSQASVPPTEASVAQSNQGSKKEDNSTTGDGRESVAETVNSTEIYLSSPDSLLPEDIENWDKLDIWKQNGHSPEIEIDVAEDPIGTVSSSSAGLSRGSSSHTGNVLQHPEPFKATKSVTPRKLSVHSISTRSSSCVGVSKTTSDVVKSKCGSRVIKGRSSDIPNETQTRSGALKGPARRSKRLCSSILSKDDPKQCVAKPRAAKRNSKLRKTLKQKSSLSSSLQTVASTEDMEILKPTGATSSFTFQDKLQIGSSPDTSVDHDLPGEQRKNSSDSSGACLTEAVLKDLIVDEKLKDRVHQAVIYAESGRGKWKDKRPPQCSGEKADDSDKFPVNEEVSVNDNKKQAVDEDMTSSVDRNQQENIPQLTATPALLEAVNNTVETIEHSTVYIENVSKLLENLSQEKNTSGEDYFVSGLLAILDTGRRLNDNMISSLKLFVSRHRNLIEDVLPCVDSCKDVNLPCLSQECPLDLRVMSGASNPSCQKGDDHFETSSPIMEKGMEANQLSVHGNGDSASSKPVKGCVVKLCKLSSAEILRKRPCLESQSWSPLTTQGDVRSGSGRSKEIKPRALSSVISSSCAALIPAQSKAASSKSGVDVNASENVDTIHRNVACMPMSEKPELRSKTELSRLVTEAAPSENTVSSETFAVSVSSGIITLDERKPGTRSSACKERATRIRTSCRSKTKRKKNLCKTEESVDQTVQNGDKRSFSIPKLNISEEEMSVIKLPRQTNCSDMEIVSESSSTLPDIIGSEGSKNGDGLGDSGNYRDIPSQDKSKIKFSKDFQPTRNSAKRSSTVDLAPRRKANTSLERCDEDALVVLNEGLQNETLRTTCRRSRSKLIDKVSLNSQMQGITGKTSEGHPDAMLCSDELSLARENTAPVESLLNSLGEFGECTKHSPHGKMIEGATEPLRFDVDQIFGEKYSNLSPDSSLSDGSLETQEQKAGPKGILLLFKI
ncbi:uncharacterized protein LOC135480532 [Liolophura sinensis]|uniref:uncharacterized protein LOC135480532 n=1 Tax=Liolophura sinensis TaxID=3198878 RepID=UPI0031585AB0